MATCILAFPDHNKPFIVESDVSDYQLGAVIKQEGRAMAYNSRKLTLTTIEKELLSVKEMLCTFCTMLLGAKIVVYHAAHHALEFAVGRIWACF